MDIFVFELSASGVVCRPQQFMKCIPRPMPILTMVPGVLLIHVDMNGMSETEKRLIDE